MRVTLAIIAAGAVIGLAAAPAAARPVSFTFDPTVIPLDGSVPFSGTAINVLDFARVDLGETTSAGTAFTETGFLQFNNISNGEQTPGRPEGLNQTYSLYVAFSGSGLQSAPTFNQSSVGTLTQLDYTLYGVNGVSTFSVSGGVPSVTNQADPVALATGSLLSGRTSLAVLDGNGVSPGASLVETVDQLVPGFFAEPVDMTFELAGAFTNDVNSVTVLNDGRTFVLNNGGGVLTFQVTDEQDVPEPMSLALLGAGLAGVGLSRRRANKPACLIG